MQPPFTLVSTISDVISATEFDEVAKSLICIFLLDIDTLLELIFTLICKEVQNAGALTSMYCLVIACSSESETTLFRGISLPIKMVSVFCNAIGREYLAYLLQPLINQLCLPEGGECKDLEMDPGKLVGSADEKAEMIQKHQLQLQDHCIVLLRHIYTSLRYCPG